MASGIAKPFGFFFRHLQLFCLHALLQSHLEKPPPVLCSLAAGLNARGGLVPPQHLLLREAPPKKLHFYLSLFELQFNHCISAPNHPGMGSDPPKTKQANAPLNLGSSSLNKCPKPPFGQCPNRGCNFFGGASLTALGQVFSRRCHVRCLRWLTWISES